MCEDSFYLPSYHIRYPISISRKGVAQTLLLVYVTLIKWLCGLDLLNAYYLEVNTGVGFRVEDHIVKIELNIPETKNALGPDALLPLCCKYEETFSRLRSACLLYFFQAPTRRNYFEGMYLCDYDGSKARHCNQKMELDYSSPRSPANSRRIFSSFLLRPVGISTVT